MPNPRKDLQEQKFGMLTAIEEAGKATNGAIRWRCKCECGNEKIATCSNLRSGSTRSCGCLAHATRTAKRPPNHPFNQRGEKNMHWKGGQILDSVGYFQSYQEGDRPTYKRIHILIAEGVLGKPLPLGAVVHHVDEDKTNNEKTNLVICENQSYHKLLHARAKAYFACGHAAWRRCCFCKQYDYPSKLTYMKSSRIFYHKDCRNKHRRQRRREKQQNAHAA